MNIRIPKIARDALKKEADDAAVNAYETTYNAGLRAITAALLYEKHGTHEVAAKELDCVPSRCVVLAQKGRILLSGQSRKFATREQIAAKRERTDCESRISSLVYSLQYNGVTYDRTRQRYFVNDEGFYWLATQSRASLLRYPNVGLKAVDWLVKELKRRGLALAA